MEYLEYFILPIFLFLIVPLLTGLVLDTILADTFDNTPNRKLGSPACGCCTCLISIIGLIFMFGLLIGSLAAGKNV